MGAKRKAALPGPEGNGILEWHTGAGTLAAAAASAGVALLTVQLGDARGKAALLAALGRGLRLPGHFGANWDALADCLADRDWLPAGGVVIALDGAARMRTSAPAEWATLSEILSETADFWRERKQVFQVVLL